ncbi:MAG: HAD family phosphatase [Winogradskyella sp.]|uniref:HAD family hydrolase n=1 Tax=Winogradskyella sp. TaxID=1883156 RepID=UPI0017C5C933|nr:HAD family phosphatase [Winogradskyella sp.]
MINTLIFDFGDVFINLDKKGALNNALDLFNLKTFDANMLNINMQYEVGEITTVDFLNYYCTRFPELDKKIIVKAWNYIIKDFPDDRLNFIKDLAKKGTYQLILLSNTNELHIDHIKQNVGFYNDFKNCFDAFYLSHEINLRKPDKAIFKFVIDKHRLNPKDCLFIDDTKENTDTAIKLGLNTWNINEEQEDVIHLFTTKKELF